MNSSEVLTDIENAINTAGSGAGITATITNGGNGALEISTAGNPLYFSSVSGTALAGLGIPAVASSGAINQVNAPQAANLTVDGISGITRSTNSISDVLSGVTLNLAQAAPGTTVTVNVAPDTTSATTTIQSFITAYNNWQSFVQQNEATQSNGQAATNAVLFGDSTLRDASLQVDSAITSMVGQLSLADIGVTLDQNNNLELDSHDLVAGVGQ